MTCGETDIYLALTPGSIGVTVASQRELNDLAQRHGFEAVEPRVEEVAAMTPAQPAEVTGDLAAKKLRWAAAALPVEFRKDEATFRAGLAALPALAAGLQRAGVPRVGTWLMPCSDELTYRANSKQHAARLAEVARVLGDHGQKLGWNTSARACRWSGGSIPSRTRSPRRGADRGDRHRQRGSGVGLVALVAGG